MRIHCDFDQWPKMLLKKMIIFCFILLTEYNPKNKIRTNLESQRLANKKLIET